MAKFFTFSLFLLAGPIAAQDEEPNNKHFWHSISTTATPEAIWEVWTDVSNWHQWDTGLKSATLSERFKKGAKGKIVSLEGRTTKFKVVAVEEGKSYTFKTNLPLGSLYVKRYLSLENGQTTFTHEVWFKGLTGGLFAKKFGPNFRALLPEVMENIKKIVEK